MYFLKNLTKKHIVFCIPLTMTPSIEITFASLNCPKMNASLRKTSQSFLEVFG